MAKRKTDWDENKLNKWLQEGRGQGEGKEYKPGLLLQISPQGGGAAVSRESKREGFIILWRILKPGTFTF